MATDSKLIPAAGLGIGALFLWSAIKGKQILSTVQKTVQGKSPTTAVSDVSQPTSITAAGEAAYAGTAVSPAGPGEKAWITALLLSIGAPPTSENISSIEAWAQHEGPWGTQGENGNNPLNTSITTTPGYEGKWSAAPIVSIFATATDGVAATAATLLTGYPAIVSALRSGNGLCGNPSIAGELSTWSDGGYSQVC